MSVLLMRAASPLAAMRSAARRGPDAANLEQRRHRSRGKRKTSSGRKRCLVKINRKRPIISPEIGQDLAPWPAARLL
jgi:hypothetical protein